MSVQIIVGDAMAKLQGLEPASVDACLDALDAAQPTERPGAGSEGVA